MFRDLAGIANLARNASMLTSKAGELKERLASIRSEGHCDGVRVEATGDHKIVRIEITEELHLTGDRTALEQRVTEACNIALKKSREAVAQEMSSMASGLGVPGVSEALAKLGIGQ